MRASVLVGLLFLGAVQPAAAQTIRCQLVVDRWSYGL